MSLRNSRRRRAHGTTLAAALLSMAAPTFAADVRIVASNPRDPFVVELRVELEQLGFSVAHEPDLAPTSNEIALVRIAEDGVELYEVRKDGVLYRRAMMSAKGDPLKAAEEVRALLLPLAPQPAAPPPFAAPRRVREPARAPVARVETPVAEWTLEASLGGGALFGGTTPGGVVVLSGALFPPRIRSRRFSVGFGVGTVLPAIAERVSRSNGETNIRAFLGGPEVIGRLGFAERSIFVDVALGSWANYVRFEGNAKTPFTSRDESAWSWSPTGRLRVQYVAGLVGVFGEARTGISLPAIAVRHAGKTTHEWGVPWASAAAGVSLSF